MKNNIRTHSPRGTMRGLGRVAAFRMESKADQLKKEGSKKEAKELTKKAKRLKHSLA